ncbi:MAG TPA: di-heme oxidoredictase family protein [Kofleriaceae bacterium]|nr:di-heme oxidoredictase family protein [Kofleriaceae bacterium]
MLTSACGTEMSDVESDPGELGSASATNDDDPQSIAAAGDALPGLTPEQLTAFEVGREDFAEVEEPDEGLGPVFNNTGCGVCHDAPATGGASSTALVEIRYGFTGPDGSFDPLSQFGGSLQQLSGIGPVEIPGCEGVSFAQETIPAEANTTAGRLTQPLFGLGLIDNVPDVAFQALAAAEAELTPETAGRVSLVTNLATGQQDVGRFGWKAQVASIADFSGDAYLNEMGITNPVFPTESCFNGDCELTARCDPAPDPEDDGTALNNFTTFMTFLAPAPALPVEGQAAIGAGVFAGIGCANCHTPALVTGSNAIAALDHKTFSPYSDFLLHDMGSLGDGIVQGGTGAREMRTSPLWGARFRVAYLHDGRATTVSQAILAHAGQGQSAADQFAGLPSALQNALLAFVGTL